MHFYPQSTVFPLINKMYCQPLLKEFSWVNKIHCHPQRGLFLYNSVTAPADPPRLRWRSQGQSTVCPASGRSSGGRPGTGAWCSWAARSSPPWCASPHYASWSPASAAPWPRTPRPHSCGGPAAPITQNMCWSVGLIIAAFQHPIGYITAVSPLTSIPGLTSTSLFSPQVTDCFLTRASCEGELNQT